MGRIIALLYGILAYALFGATFLYAVGFVADLFVPKTIDSGPAGSPAEALVIDLALMSVFALQHSIMARKGFKEWWTRIVPKSVERSTYVMLSNFALMLLFWQWRPLPAVVWHVSDPRAALALFAVSMTGYLLVFTSTFLINHFELFGLHQVANNLIRRPMPEPRFRTPLYYRFVRHPLYLGFVIAFWATPKMTVGHLMFAAVTTTYMVVAALLLEERDMIETFGDDYRRYRARVPMLLPWRRPI